MIVVGVTGKYCAGKNTVTEILAEHGYAVIDEDRVGHEVLAIERDRIVGAFGDAICASDGSIDRRALGRIVFSDAHELRRLEAVMHPVMVDLTARRVASIRESAARAASSRDVGQYSPPGVVINAAILFRMGLHALCDIVVLVRAPFRETRRRARARDGASLLQVVRRLSAQRDVAPQHSRMDADIHSVENDGDREKLRARLSRILPLP